MESISLEIKRSFCAPIEKVWKAWVEPAQLSQWFNPGSMETIVNKMNFEEGGAFSIMMKGDMKGQMVEHTANGKYETITPMTDLAFTWKWAHAENETLITVRFLDQGNRMEDRTDIVFKHERFADEKTRDMHHEGWTSAMKNLEKMLG